MNQLFTISALLVVTVLSNAQTPNFFADGSRWVYHNYETYEPGMNVLHSSDEQIVIRGDTVVGGINYFKLYHTFHFAVEVLYQHQTLYSYGRAGPTFLRYDTLSKRVYHLPDVDSLERLIYDFSLQIGDTVPLQMTDGWSVTVIDSIDSITVFGVPAKRFFLDFGIDEPWLPNFIIEGIGGTNGLLHFQPEYPYLGGGFYMTHFNCFQYGDSIYSPENLECPFIDFISSIQPPEEQPALTISPNPAPKEFTLTIDPVLLNAGFILTDASGRVVKSFTITETATVVQMQVPGIYFWSVEYQGRKIKTGKIVIQ